MEESKRVRFEEAFKSYWKHVKDVVDDDGWVYSKTVPYLLDFYFEANTDQQIEFQKHYDSDVINGEYRGYRWRPKILSKTE